MINQADVVLLQYPLNLNLSEEARLSSLSLDFCLSICLLAMQVAYNDIVYYQNVTDPNGYFTGDKCAAVPSLLL
jgi:hypothetical protein